MPHLPDALASTRHDTPVTAAQLEQIDRTLHTLIGLMAPLHRLLTVEEEREDTTTRRLVEILDGLAAITSSFQTAAETLMRPDTVPAVPPAVAAMMEQLVDRQTDLAQQVASLELTVRTLAGWLGAPHPLEAAQSS